MFARCGTRSSVWDVSNAFTAALLIRGLVHRSEHLVPSLL